MRKPVTQSMLDMANRLIASGINYEQDRWSEGIDHDPRSEALVRELADIDWLLFGDYFGWKIGGDGDSGETLMYQIDLLFALRDAENGLSGKNGLLEPF